MFKGWLVTTGVLLAIIFGGCEREITTEVHKVHWDRDMCERCKMVVSDRTHTVQVINPQNGRSYMFDDIGCSILWLIEEKISWADQAIIWITDKTSGEWINARTAYYDTTSITPMAYGIAAHKERSSIKEGEETIDFADVKKRVLTIEENYNKKSY